MTVAEYQQAQKDIAEIKAQIAQLSNIIDKGVPAMRGVYGLDQPEAEQPATNAPIPPMLSAHEQVGTPNVNPFQDNFTPNTNTASMQEIAGQVAPQVDQSLPERLARGAMNIPVGMAAMAEQATSDPAGFGKGTAEYVAEWGQRINPVVSPESMEAKLNFGKQLQTDPIGTTLDVAGVAGTALGLPKLGGKIKGFKSIKEARAAINDIGKPKVDVPEVVQEPIRSETPIQQPTTATEVVAKAKPNAVTKDVKTLTPEELTAAQARLREKFKPMDEVTKPQTPQTISAGVSQRGDTPLRIDGLYHGTKSSFENFDIAKAGQTDAGLVGKALYFTPTKEQALSFANNPFYGTKTGGEARIVEASVSLKRPLIIQDGHFPDGRSLTDIHKNGITKQSANAIEREIKSGGYDGVVFKLGDDITQVAVYDKGSIVNNQKPSQRAGKISTEPPKATPDAGATPAQSIKPTTAEAVVKKAGEKKAVTVKQAASVVKQEAQATTLTDKSFKTQMKSEIESALRDAPDRPQELQDMVDSYNYLDENRRGMDWETAEARLKEKRGEIDELKNRLGVKTVTIEIPGDGTFKIEHSKQSLLELQKRLGRNIETKVPEVKSTPHGGDRGLQGARLNGYDVSVFDDATIRPSGTKGLSTIKVDYRNDPVAKKLGIVTNSHYLVEESALSKHPKQIQMSDKMLDEKRVSEMLESFDKVKYDENPAKEVVTYNDGLNNKVIFDNGDVFVGFSGEYIEFLKNSVGDFSLKLSGETTPAAIMSGNKRVGVIMPLKTSEQFAITRPPSPTELHSGVNPFKIIDDYMTKRKLVNPLGTPEIVLRGKGIVEPFREAGELMRNDMTTRGEKLRSMLEGVKRDSPDDYAVFGKLDDPNAILPKREQEIRNYLDELLGEVNKHREARGQEPVKYRKGYITHLPTDAKMSEILDILEKASADYGDTPMPKKFRFQFEKARKGDLDYKMSAIDALEVYTQAALKDIYIGDALAKAVPNIDKLGGKPLLVKNAFTTPDGKTVNITEYRWTDSPIMTERGYAEAFIKGQMNVPTMGQRALKAMFDIRPNTSMKVAHATTGTFYRSLLGLAVDSGIKNLTQNINTLAEYGVLPSMKGFAKFVTPKGLKEAKAQHLLDDFNPMLLEGHDLPMKSKVGQAIGKGFAATLNAPMKVAEFINRGIAYHTAYDVNIKKGLPLEAAHDLAREGVRKTQFSYSKVDTSPALRGPFARLATQFLSYPIKQSELMYKWATMPGEQGKLARYFLYAGMAVMGAKYGGVDVAGVFFDPIKMVDPNSKEGMELPWSDQRVKFDWSKLGQSGYTPRGLTPIVSIPKEFIQSQMSDEESTREYGREKALSNILPGGRYGKKVYDVVTESDEKGKRDRLTRENTDKDKVLKLLGFRGTEREAESSRRESVVEVEKKYYATRQKLIDLKISGDMDEFTKIRDEFRAQYPFLYGRLMKGFSDAVKDERKKKGMTSDERFFDNSLRKQIDANL